MKITRALQATIAATVLLGISAVMLVGILSRHQLREENDAVQVRHKAAENINSVNKLRKVILKYEGGKTSEELMLEGDVEKFVEASIQLHHDPGVNPHNGEKAAKVETICVQKIRASGPFWWTTPGLKKNDDPKGAVIFTWQPDHCAFPRIGSKKACLYCAPHIGW